MAKGTRGGKRAAGIATSRPINNYIDSFESKGTYINESVRKLNPVLVNETLHGVSDTLHEFGFDESEVKSIGTLMFSGSKDAEASVNGLNHLSLSTRFYSDNTISDFNDTGYTINGSAYGIGTHEAGHIISNIALHNYAQKTGMSNLQRAEMRKNGKFATIVIKDAKKNAGKLTTISKYSRTKNDEYVAEAVCDYMTNKRNANPSSLAIVNALKRYL